ncbi:MAG: hypothetical protein IBX69_00075 [Anaerolineales bacterium]|nr:hypothetical protein [Anaerolineales bacterium]
MKYPLFFLPWLVTAALFEWLVVRTLTRLAIFMPKSDLITSIYRSLTSIGNLASTLSAVLVMAALIWIIWKSFRPDSLHIAALIWMSALALNLIFLVLPGVGVLAVVFQVFMLLAVIVVGWRAISTASESPQKFSILIPVLALVCGRLYQIFPLAYEAFGLPGPVLFSGFLFNAGELFVVASSFILWWTYARKAPLSSYIMALIPVLAFTGLRLMNPSMAGILSIWSMGLTLYLPWPLYAISLWLAVVVVLANINQDRHVAVAVILLAAGGYAPQLTTQAFYGLVALWCFMLDERWVKNEADVDFDNSLQLERAFNSKMS